MLSFSLRDVLDEIWDLTESVSEGFPIYSYGSAWHIAALVTSRRFPQLHISLQLHAPGSVGHVSCLNISRNSLSYICN